VFALRLCTTPSEVSDNCVTGNLTTAENTGMLGLWDDTELFTNCISLKLGHLVFHFIVLVFSFISIFPSLFYEPG
jgi:hypothetical protein